MIDYFEFELAPENELDFYAGLYNLYRYPSKHNNYSFLHWVEVDFDLIFSVNKQLSRPLKDYADLINEVHQFVANCSKDTKYRYIVGENKSRSPFNGRLIALKFLFNNMRLLSGNQNRLEFKMLVAHLARRLANSYNSLVTTAAKFELDAAIEKQGTPQSLVHSHNYLDYSILPSLNEQEVFSFFKEQLVPILVMPDNKQRRNRLVRIIYRIVSMNLPKEYNYASQVLTGVISAYFGLMETKAEFDDSEKYTYYSKHLAKKVANILGPTQ